MILVLHGKKSEEKIADICIEHDIPYICIVGRNYRTASGQNRNIKKYNHKVMVTQVIDEVLHYCEIWTDHKVEGNSLDAEELSEIIGTDQYVFMYDVDPKTFKNAITIVERDGNMSNMQTFKTESNPIFFCVRNMY